MSKTTTQSFCVVNIEFIHLNYGTEQKRAHTLQNHRQMPSK